MNLSVIFKLRGVNFTIAGACASGSHAIGMGYLLIKSGLQDCILCGGAQEVNPYAVGSFDGLSAFSTQEAEPEKASKPFDKRRDGLIPSGGAASLVLESYESAVKRGAPILAEVIGYGFSSNGDHISVPNVDCPCFFSSLRFCSRLCRVGERLCVNVSNCGFSAIFYICLYCFNRLLTFGTARSCSEMENTFLRVKPNIPANRFDGKVCTALL